MQATAVRREDRAMARLPRIDLPGVPQHVVQRGNNRLPCFLDDGDRLRYVHLLADALVRFACELHAYVLMDNHVHLLLTPRSPGAVSRLMHTFSRNYVGLFNARHGRTGTLWEGRYKACLVDSEAYVLVCSRYIELNPVRAAMVEAPGQYRWSSHGALAPWPAGSIDHPAPCVHVIGKDDGGSCFRLPGDLCRSPDSGTSRSRSARLAAARAGNEPLPGDGGSQAASIRGDACGASTQEGVMGEVSLTPFLYVVLPLSS
jgi:putative transposase